jgi:hypothetical protein
MVFNATYNSIRHGRYRMVVGLQLLMQSSPITTYILTLNIAHGEVYPIQHYMIKLVNDLWFSLGIFNRII